VAILLVDLSLLESSTALALWLLCGGLVLKTFVVYWEGRPRD
jgi:hypothetical protein